MSYQRKSDVRNISHCWLQSKQQINFTPCAIKIYFSLQIFYQIMKTFGYFIMAKIQNFKKNLKLSFIHMCVRVWERLFCVKNFSAVKFHDQKNSLYREVDFWSLCSGLFRCHNRRILCFFFFSIECHLFNLIYRTG